MKLLGNIYTYRDCPFQSRSRPTATGWEYWVEWSDWDGSWLTPPTDDPDSAIAIAKLAIDAKLDVKIIEFKPRK